VEMEVVAMPRGRNLKSSGSDSSSTKRPAGEGRETLGQLPPAPLDSEQCLDLATEILNMTALRGQTARLSRNVIAIRACPENIYRGACLASASNAQNGTAYHPVIWALDMAKGEAGVFVKLGEGCAALVTKWACSHPEDTPGGRSKALAGISANANKRLGPRSQELAEAWHR
jgi:hypothetical protein